MKNRIIKISAIAAMAKNRVIGHNNQLPWHLPADLRRFKQITSGHTILMGRKTYESIGRPLPNRVNLVMTKNPSWQAPGCMTVSSLEQALTYADNELFIIGGANIYQQLLPRVDRLYLTILQQDYTGDSYFPIVHWNEWQEIANEKYLADETNRVAYHFLVLERINS